MALGRQRDRQAEMLVAWSEMPRSPGHVFYDRLQVELVAAGFDGFVEGQCAPCYAARRGRPSLPPGRYFRMLLVGYFEGIDSERGLEWRCADSRGPGPAGPCPQGQEAVQRGVGEPDRPGGAHRQTEGRPHASGPQAGAR